MTPNVYKQPRTADLDPDHHRFAYKHHLHISSDGSREERSLSEGEIPESTRQRYAAMEDDSEHYDSFGDPNFHKLVNNGPALTNPKNRDSDPEKIKIGGL